MIQVNYLNSTQGLNTIVSEAAIELGNCTLRTG